MNMRWDTHAQQPRQTLEWDNVVPRPQGKHIMQNHETPGKCDTMGAILRGKVKPPVETHHPHLLNPESADMYAIMSAQSHQKPGLPLPPPFIKRKRVFNHVPGEEHAPVFEERFAWLVKPKQQPVQAEGAEPAKVRTLSGATHPIGVQRDKPWH